MTAQETSRARSRSISDREVLKLSGILLPNHTDVFYSCLGGTSMAPLNDLIHLFPIALKDRFDTTIPAVFNPAVYTQPESCRLGMMAKKDSLNPSFDNDPCPYLFHVSLSHMPAKLFAETYGRKTVNSYLLPHGRGTESGVDPT